jgi:hypothetical protein
MNTNERILELNKMMGIKVNFMDKLFYTYKMRYDIEWDSIMNILDYIKGIDGVDFLITGDGCQISYGDKYLSLYNQYSKSSMFNMISDFAIFWNNLKDNK